MTGYGRGEVSREGYNITVEIKSVNHRYCDINIRTPKHLVCLEDKIKSKIKETVDRGRFEVFFNIESENEDEHNIKVNVSLANAYMDAVELLGREIGIYSDITMDRFLDFPDIIVSERKETDTDDVWRITDEALGIALFELVDMRATEGENILKDILGKIEVIETELESIEKLKENVVEEYKIKLENRINDILKDKSLLDEYKLANEVAHYADKSNIDEEIVRLHSHLEQLREVAESEGSIGKKLDFIIQEMNRETNTIGSKTGNISITNSVVEIKSKIEEIREQIQNVE